MRVLIVGGVAGGASAAARLRRIDEKAEIIVFEKGPHISYANCGLPYYIGNVIADKERLLVQTPEGMKDKFNIDVRVNSEVTAIYPDKKEVEVYDIKTHKSYKENYDKLILSPGAEPIRPKIPGIDAKNIFTLRNIPDTYAIREFVDVKKPQKAVVVGGGFIGIEMAENLKTRGIDTSIVELSNQVIAPIDIEMAAMVHQKLESENVKLILNDGVKAFRELNDGIELELNSGRKISADMIILSIGVRPETHLAKDAGLKLGLLGGIAVDSKMKTSDPDIYAVGDAVEVIDLVNKNSVLIPLAGPANKQGRIAANDIAGKEDNYEGTLGASIVKVFDLIIASVGNNEKTLKKYGVKYEKIYTHSYSHAGYYPNALPLSMKLIFNPGDGKILGAQIVGYEGVDKRIDVLAVAMRAGMTVFNLQELELAYAPPFSSAKDPVNMAGYVAANVINGDLEIIHWDEIGSLDKDKTILIDNRTELEHSMGAIEDSINIPLERLRERIAEIPKDKNIVLYCQVGVRGYFAYRILKQLGYDNVRNLAGGYKTYQAAFGKHIEENKFATEDDFRPTNNSGESLDVSAKIKVDACGLQCPGPIMQVNNAVTDMDIGEILEVKATDPAFMNDIKAWCRNTGNSLLDVQRKGTNIVAYIKKGEGKTEIKKSTAQEKTMVVFSGDLDKAIASFIIANGAAAMGNQVTMFFTFWGLNIIRRSQYVKVRKNFVERAFGYMMPRGSNKLKLSKMNMGGMGSRLIKHIMKAKNIESLEELIEKSKQQGVKLIACSMSADVMGLRTEEFIDGVEIGGVATFLDSADRANMSLFI